MSPILVSGLINLESTLKVDGFPIACSPVRYPFGGVNSSVSGVGYDLAKALTTLGNDVDLLSLIGADRPPRRSALASYGRCIKAVKSVHCPILNYEEGKFFSDIYRS
ncbi:MAG: hypothetical protein J0M33_24570 [Anaerolineae bacterium]|nr:hypothetical protein [Anaerolineae bacterium]